MHVGSLKQASKFLSKGGVLCRHEPEARPVVEGRPVDSAVRNGLDFTVMEFTEQICLSTARTFSPSL